MPKRIDNFFQTTSNVHTLLYPSAQPIELTSASEAPSYRPNGEAVVIPQGTLVQLLVTYGNGAMLYEVVDKKSTYAQRKFLSTPNQQDAFEVTR